MANDCLNKGNLDEARRIYTTVSKEYSNDWRGWWGIICSTPLPESIFPTGIATDSKQYFLDYEFKMALSFAPDNQKNIINQYKQKRLNDFDLIKNNTKKDSQIKQLRIDTENKQKRIIELQEELKKYEEKIDSNNKVNFGFTVAYFVIVLTVLLIPSISNWWLLLIVPIGAIVLFGIYFGDSDIRLTKEFRERNQKSIEALNKTIAENDSKLKALLKEKTN